MGKSALRWTENWRGEGGQDRVVKWYDLNLKGEQEETSERLKDVKRPRRWKVISRVGVERQLERREKREERREPYFLNGTPHTGILSHAECVSAKRFRMPIVFAGWQFFVSIIELKMFSVSAGNADQCARSIPSRRFSSLKGDMGCHRPANSTRADAAL